MSNSAKTALCKAARGLMFMSEKDAPFKVQTLATEGDVNAENILALAKLHADTPVKEEKFDRLFGELCKEQKWHGEDEKAFVKKYQQLQQTLKHLLSDLKVFKLGEVHVKVFIVGKTPEGQWLSLQTEALET